jgi:hypothetical protein
VRLLWIESEVLFDLTLVPLWSTAPGRRTYTHAGASSATRRASRHVIVSRLHPLLALLYLLAHYARLYTRRCNVGSLHKQHPQLFMHFVHTQPHRRRGTFREFFEAFTKAITYTEQINRNTMNSEASSIFE